MEAIIEDKCGAAIVSVCILALIIMVVYGLHLTVGLEWVFWAVLGGVIVICVGGCLALACGTIYHFIHGDI